MFLRRPSRLKGFALIAVLWLLAFLTIMATTVLAVTRNSGRLAQRGFETVKAEALADSGIRVALLQLTTDDPQRPQWTHANGRTLNIWGAAVSVEVENESGRIDINMASEQLLAAYFARTMDASGDIQRAAQMLVQHRESRRAYPSSAIGDRGEGKGPAFKFVEELRRLPGLSELGGPSLDGLTVYTNMPTPRAMVASEAVKRALADVGILEAAADSSSAVETESTRLKVGDIVRVHSCAASEKVEVCREAIVRLTGSKERPFQVFMWRCSKTV